METSYKFGIITLRFFLVKPVKKRLNSDVLNSEYPGIMYTCREKYLNMSFENMFFQI